MTRPAERKELRGQIVGGEYQLGAPLGIGGTSVVFRAVRLRDDARCVVKVLRDAFVHNIELIRRLRREAEVARRVAHPGIVPVWDEGLLEDGSPFLVMERLDGECVARLLRRRGAMDPNHVAVVTLRAAAVLHSVHAAGYVHRDIKPEHIVLSRAVDGRLEVRIIDFGVCASETASEAERDKERGRVYGTPAYVSPEQASGIPEVDGRADVFGLGVMMFEALTGRQAFGGKNVPNLLRRIIREDAPRVGLIVDDLDLRFDSGVARAMARRPSERFASARALSRAVLPLVEDRRMSERELAKIVRHTQDRLELVATEPDITLRDETSETRRAVA